MRLGISRDDDVGFTGREVKNTGQNTDFFAIYRFYIDFSRFLRVIFPRRARGATGRVPSFSISVPRKNSQLRCAG